MGHIVWNRVKNGKTLEPTKAAMQIMNEGIVYIIAFSTSKSKIPSIVRVQINKAIYNSSGLKTYIQSGDVFEVRNINDKHNSFVKPENCFPSMLWHTWNEHKTEFLKYCGNYVDENNDELVGFPESVYGTINNPRHDWKIGFGSVWYTTDKSEAELVLKLVKKYLSQLK